jgi:hypothetical protein
MKENASQKTQEQKLIPRGLKSRLFDWSWLVLGVVAAPITCAISLYFSPLMNQPYYEDQLQET